MGSAVVAGMVENFGYLQLPFRGSGLGELNAQNPECKRKFFEKLKNKANLLAQPQRKGGLSAENRNLYVARTRVAETHTQHGFDKLEEELDNLTLSEVYERCRKTIGDSLTYKECAGNTKGHVELWTLNDGTISRSSLQRLRGIFQDVKIIALRREFVDWVESIASQRFVSKGKWQRFYLKDLIIRYGTYYAALEELEDSVMEIDFADIFSPNTHHTALRIAEFLNQNHETAIELDSYDVDVFGQLIPFRKATALEDRPGRYLSSITRRAVRFFVPTEHPKTWRSANIALWQSSVVYVLYLLEYCRYHLRAALANSRNGM